MTNAKSREALVNSLKALENNDGLTLKGYKTINYKTGYQLADYGKETRDTLEAAKMIESMNGDAGVWYSEGVFYIDHSFRVKTLREAIALGMKYAQQSILRWRDKSLIWLK